MFIERVAAAAREGTFVGVSCLYCTLLVVLRSKVTLSRHKENYVCCVCLPAAHRSTVPMATCWISSGRTAATRELMAMAAALRSRAGEDNSLASSCAAAGWGYRRAANSPVNTLLMPCLPVLCAG